MQRGHDGDAAQKERPPAIADDHHCAPVPAIHQRARWQRQQKVRRRPERGHQPRLRGRVGQRQRQQRERQMRDLCADIGDRLPRIEQDEFAVAPERLVGR